MTPLRAHSSWVTGGRASAAHRLRRVGEIARQVLAGGVAVVDRLDRAAVIFLDAAALLDPFDAGALEPLLDVDRRIVVGIDAGRIVDRQRRLARRRIERDLTQRHPQVRRRLRHRIDLARAGNRAGGDLRGGEIGFGKRLVHRGRSLFLLSEVRAIASRNTGHHHSSAETGDQDLLRCVRTTQGRVLEEVSVPSPA